jgi:hypothetical protein
VCRPTPLQLARALSIRASDSGVACSSHSARGRHVGCGGATSTYRPAHLRQPLHERGAVAKRGRMIVFADDALAAGARAPAEHRAFERAHARRQHVDVRVAAPPAAPRADLLVARLDAPRRYMCTSQSLPRFCRRAAQARADGVEQRLRQPLRLRLLHAERPDALQHGVVGGERLRGDRRRAGQQGSRGRVSDLPHCPSLLRS